MLAVPPKSRFPQLRLRLPGNLGTDDKIILALGIVLLVLLLTGVLS